MNISPTEQEEFEFRLRLEREQAAPKQAEPTILGKAKQAAFPFQTALSKRGGISGALLGNVGTLLDVATAIPRGIYGLQKGAEVGVAKGLEKVTGLPFKGGEEAREDLISRIPKGKFKQFVGEPGIRMGTDVSTYLGPAAFKHAMGPAKPFLKTTPKQLGFRAATPKAREALEIQDIVKGLPAKKTLAEPIKEITETVGGAKLVPSAAQKPSLLTPRQRFLPQIDPGDRSMLSELLGKKDTAFTEYAKIARAAKANPRSASPMKVSGTKAKKALDEVSAMVQDAGKRKGKIVGKKANDFLLIDKVQEKFDRLVLERAGGVFDEAGELVSAPGRQLRVPPADQNILKGIRERISNNLILVSEADDIKAGIREAVDAQKATQVKQINTIAEGIGKVVRGDIDNLLVKKIGPRFRKINTEYAQLKTLENEMNRRLGRLVDPITGETTHGASLMKSAIQSNADRGTHAMFEQIKKLTGIDLIKEAKYAEISMKAVGDPRIKNLLEEVGGAVPGKAGLALRGVQAAGKIGRQDALSEAVEIYLKAQKRGSKQAIKQATGAQTFNPDVLRQQAIARKLGY